MSTSRLLTSITVAGLGLVACGGADPSSVAPGAATTEASAPRVAAGVRLVSAIDAKTTIDDAPDDLVILDVRTPEEFAEGHLDGAIMIDFYRDDFASELAKLDPDVPYVLYCRSGNRSGQTSALMAQLQFRDVQDVDGGILGWQDAGLAVVVD